MDKQVNRYEYTLMLLLFLAWGFVFLDRTSLSYLTPIISKELHLNNSNIALINMWQTIGYAVSALIIGVVSDRTGYRKRILLISVVSTSLFTALSALAHSYHLLLVLRTLVGISEGPVLPMAIVLTAMASKPGRFGLNIGIINAGVPVISSTIGPTLVTQLVSYSDWRMTFLIVSIPSIIVALLIWKFVKEVPLVKDENIHSSTKERKTNILEVLKYRNINLCIIIAIFCMSSLWIHYSFTPLYLVQIGHHSLKNMGFIMSGMGLVGVLWVILVPYLSDFFGRKFALILFSFVFFFVPFCLYLSPGTWLGVSAVILFGSVIGALPTIFLNIIPVETVPSLLTTTATSLVMGVGEVSGSLILGWSGSLADSYGLPVIMIFAAICTILMALFGFGIIETKAKKKDLSLSNNVEEMITNN